MVEKSIYIANTDFMKCSSFQKSMFDESSISWDRIWIAGRPWSRQDPPRPRKNAENLKKTKIRKFGVGGPDWIGGEGPDQTGLSGSHDFLLIKRIVLIDLDGIFDSKRFP